MGMLGLILISCVLGVTSIILLMRAMLVVVTVENQSMSPALQHGDCVLVVRYWPRRWLRRGHIVIVWPWQRSQHGPKPFGVPDPFIKRIVGLPGDTLVTHISELDDFNREQQRQAHDEHGYRTWRIPPDHCFLRGDHPIGGFDSLSWGPVPFEYVLGLVIKTLPRRVDARATEIPASTYRRHVRR